MRKVKKTTMGLLLIGGVILALLLSSDIRVIVGAVLNLVVMLAPVVLLV